MSDAQEERTFRLVYFKTLPADTLCLGAVLKLPECDLAFKIPDGLSDSSFDCLRQWLISLVAGAEKRRFNLGGDIAQMSDASDRDKAGQGAEDPVVRSVIEQLDKRVVSSGDRVRLRGSLDKADAPLTGRDGADASLGRAIRSR
jgi:hypothetical protein